MNNNPDEIILHIMDELQLSDVLSMRLSNRQLYRCSYNAIAFIEGIVGFFRRFEIKEEVFNIARKIPGFDFTIEDNYAIRWVSAYGYIQHMEFLIDRGANIHVNGDWPLALACRYGHIDIVRCLVKHGADIYVNNGRLLALACINGHWDTVKYMIDNNADVHVENDYPLRVAAEFGSVDVVRYLIDHGADIHVDNDYCFRKGTPEVVEYLKSLIKKN